MQIHSDLYVGGEWTAATGSNVIEVVNPATEQVIATVPAASTSDADRAVGAARAAFPAWSQLSVEERVNYVERIADALAERSEEIAALISSEQGMPMTNARRVQAGLPIMVMKSFCGNRPRVRQHRNPKHIGHSLVFEETDRCVHVHHPVENYPLHQTIGKVAPALVAGCTMILKPSSENAAKTRSCSRTSSIVSALPAGRVSNLVTGAGRTVGEALCVHPEVDMISITGSTEAGARIAELGAPTVKRICQELGGKISERKSSMELTSAKAVPAGITGMMLKLWPKRATALTRMIVPAQSAGRSRQLGDQRSRLALNGRPDERRTLPRAHSYRHRRSPRCRTTSAPASTRGLGSWPEAQTTLRGTPPAFLRPNQTNLRRRQETRW